VTVGQLMAALSEYRPDLMVDVEVQGERVDLLGMAKTGGGLWLTLEVDRDQVSQVISDYVEEHRNGDGTCDL
jgi:hypothetical protein